MSSSTPGPHGCPARTALAEALACLYALTRVDGSVIGYQTVNLVPPASYARWQTTLNGEQPLGGVLPPGTGATADRPPALRGPNWKARP